MIDCSRASGRGEEERDGGESRGRDRASKRGAVTNDSVFRHSGRYSGSNEKELGYYRHSPGVAAQFAWQLFVKACHELT